MHLSDNCDVRNVIFGVYIAWSVHEHEYLRMLHSAISHKTFRIFQSIHSNVGRREEVHDFTTFSHDDLVAWTGCLLSRTLRLSPSGSPICHASKPGSFSVAPPVSGSPSSLQQPVCRKLGYLIFVLPSIRMIRIELLRMS